MRTMDRRNHGAGRTLLPGLNKYGILKLISKVDILEKRKVGFLLPQEEE